MKKLFTILIISAVLVSVLASGVMAFDGEKALKGEYTWEEIVAAAKEEGKVTYYGWGGSSLHNQWIDNFVGKMLMGKYGIKLERVPMNIEDILNKMLAEKQADKETGIIDTVWINGENFKTAYQADLLWGSYAELLPNFQKYCDPEAVKFDFGFNNHGYESPFDKALFTFGYDTARFDSQPFTTIEGIKQFVKDNPGRFTYAAPPDFMGSAFVRQVFYATTGGYKQWMGKFDKEKFEEKAQATWDFLNEIEPYLWRKGNTYPESNAKLQSMFQMGQVDVIMDYSPLKVQNLINQGKIPPTCRSFILEQGVLSNTNYVTIPANAPHKAAALVLANLMLEPEVQISKLDPNNRGGMIVLDMEKLSQEEKNNIKKVDLGPATLPIKELNEKAIPELNSDYLEAIEQGWIENVLKK